MGANCCKTEAQEEKLTQDQQQQQGHNVSQDRALARPVDSMHSIKTHRQNHHHNLSKASDASSSMYYSCAGDEAKKFFAAYAHEEGPTGNPYESRSRFSTYAKKMGGLPESSLDAQVFDGTQYRDRQENEISISKLGESEGVSMGRNTELEKEYLAPPAYQDQILAHPDLQRDAAEDDDDDDEFFEPKSHMSEMAESRFSERPSEFRVPQNEDENDVPVTITVEENKEEATENVANPEENKITTPTLEIDAVKEENDQNTQQEDIDTCDPKTFPTENFDTEQQEGEAFLSQASVSDSENLAAPTENTEQNQVEITV